MKDSTFLLGIKALVDALENHAWQSSPDEKVFCRSVWEEIHVKLDSRIAEFLELEKHQ